ncbi:response regulator [Leptolyngbya sp. FACHB-17]|uniref:response regulator n=1 Tax=unclassified Leptolyngbya TaxID=2650499 RepID=UPI0016804F04|nr:response regulator [Leptolyngbya sp. FACHB-17]MBD2080434.1 response regulator [Leptolyngbya sp. FACHB-17]
MDVPPILLVEDDPKEVLLIQRAFRKAEIAADLHIINDGEQAIAYLAGQPPFEDRVQYPLPMLILLDLKLPRRSGAEVLAWLRQQPGLKRIPVVMLTASREYADVNRTYDLGVNAYMVKPVSFNQLVEIVNTLHVHWLVLNEKPQIDIS